MPNYCVNKLVIEGPKDGVVELLDKIKCKDTILSFAKIIPEPDWNKDNYNWREWRWENWHSKWDAVMSHISFENEKENCKCVEICFDTAENPPIPIIKVLANLFPDILLTLTFVELDGRCCTGIFQVRGDNILKEEIKKSHYSNQPNYFKTKNETYYYRVTGQVFKKENIGMIIECQLDQGTNKITVDKEGYLLEQYPYDIGSQPFVLLSNKIIQDEFDNYFQEIDLDEWLDKLGNYADKDGPSWRKKQLERIAQFQNITKSIIDFNFDD